MAQEVVSLLRHVLAVDRSDLAKGFQLAGADADAFKRKLDRAMTDAEKMMDRSTQAVRRLEGAMRGDRLLSSANNIAAAIQKVGGATKLSEAEQARYNVTLQKAVEKYRLLGKEAPAALLAAERATRSLNQQAAVSVTSATKVSSAWRNAGQQAIGALSGMGVGRFAGVAGIGAAVTMGVGFIANLGREAIATAGKLDDMSAATGHSAEFLQRMAHGMKQAGGTLEDFSNASFRLGVRLSSGNSSVVAALKALGLEFETLRRLSPDEQARKILTALTDVGNAQERNRLGVDLYGKAWANVSAAVANNIIKVGDSIDVLKDKQVKALADAEDTLGRLRDLGVRIAGGALAVPFTVHDQAVEAAQPKGPTTIRPIIGLQRVDDMQQAVSAAAGAMPRMFPGLTSRGTQLRLTDEVAKLDEAVRKLTPAMRAQIDAAQILGQDALEQVRVSYGLTDDVIQRYTQTQKTATKVTTDAARETERLAEAQRQRRAALTGEADITAAMQLADDLRTIELTLLSGAKRDEVNASMRAAIEAAKRLRRELPPEILGLAVATERYTVDQIQNWENLGNVVSSLPERYAAALAMIPAPLAPIVGQALDVSMLTGEARPFADVMERLQQFDFNQDVKAYRDEAERARVSTLAWTDALESLGGALAHVGASTDGMLALATTAASQFLVAMTGNTPGQRGYSMLTGAGGTMRDRMTGAMHMGTAALQAVGTLQGFNATVTAAGDSRGNRALAGGMLGAQAGAAFGPYGMAAGFGIGAFAGSMNDPGLQGRKAANAWLRDLAHSFDLVATEAQRAEIETGEFSARLAGSRSVEFQKGLVLLRDAYVALELPAERAQRDLEAIAEAAMRGPEAAARAIAKVDDILRRSEQLFDARKQKQEMLNAAVERWGLTAKEAGRGFQFGQLATAAETFAQDWKLLTDSGANPSVVAAKMAASVNEFMAAAEEAGTDIPESMQPILRALQQQGLLMHANGLAYSELEFQAIRWGRTLETMFERVLEKLEAFIDTLMDVPDVLNHVRIPNPLTGTYTGATAVARQHMGGFIARAHGGEYIGPRPVSLFGRLAHDEQPRILQVGEGVTRAAMTSRFGGRAWVDAVNSGNIPSAVSMMMGGPVRVSDPFASIPSLLEMPNRFMGANVPPAVSSPIGLDKAGDTNHFHLNATVNINSNGDTARDVDAIIDGLKTGLQTNRRGIRTTLIQKVGKGQ